jgi:SAM-dependent methyltransferase
VANVEQAEYWDGEAGARWVAEQAEHDRMLEAFGLAALDAAQLSPTHDILDVGCGTGALSRQAARRVTDGSVLGIDLSTAMLHRAREVAIEEGLGHCSYEQADAQTHSFTPGSVDVVVSRFGVMFFDDPVAAFANIRTAMRDDGRLSFACWQSVAENEWFRVPGAAIVSVIGMPPPMDPHAPGPFAFADADHVRRVLTDAGFGDVTLDDRRASVPIADDVAEATRIVRSIGISRRLLEGQPADLVSRAEEALADALAPYASPDGVALEGAVWVVTATTA